VGPKILKITCLTPVRMRRSMHVSSAGIIALIVFVGGCASWQATADTWKGRKLDELIVSWGPPASVHQLEDGRKSVLFNHSRFVQGTQYYCNVTFNTDPSDVILSSKIDGNIGGCNRFFGSKGPSE